MASDSAAVTWNANTDPDLLGYFLQFGQQSGIYISTIGLTLQTFYTITSTQFNNDGLWYFALQARDTSGNVSVLTTPVSKRIVRTASKLRVKR